MVLTKLAEYGDDGISKATFCDLMGDGDELVRNEPCKSALAQMFFTRQGYFDQVVGTDTIFITDAGRKALEE